MSATDGYRGYDALGLAELVRTRQASARELLEAAIRRVESGDARLNAVVLKLYERARADAALVDDGKAPAGGPFTGVPFLVKDLMSTVEGTPTSYGSRLLRDVAMPVDSELVRRWRASGLIVFGKTNTPEIGLVPFTEPEAFGATHNPWSLDRSPGGSSGGSAAAIAAGYVPMASGGDGGGSIRIPASCCGLFGLKPSRGRTPTGPALGEAWRGFAIEHVLTRSVRDSAAALDATGGADAGAPYAAPPRARPFLDEVTAEPPRLRVAFTATPLFRHGAVHEDCRRGLDETARLLEGLGHLVEEGAPEVDTDGLALDFQTVLYAESAATLDWAFEMARRKPSIAWVEPATWATRMLGRTTPASEYAAALNRLQLAGRVVGRFFERYDVLLTPTLAQPPILIGALQPRRSEALGIRALAALRLDRVLRALPIVERIVDKIFGYMPYTALFNASGNPAMSVPLHWNAAGLPIGMQFVARFGDEATLFRLAGQLERARPWFDKAPPGF